LYLDGLPKWINEFRSYGLCPILGYQNFAQLQHTYGRELSKAIFAACGTKVFFNPRDDETAGLVSRYLGEKEVRLHTRSHSYGMQRSTSRNEQYQKVSLLTVDEILKLDQGECVFINPAYKGQGEASVPLKLKLKISKREDELQQASERLWRETARDRLTQQMAKLQITEAELDAEAEKRQQIAESQFPLQSSDEASTNRSDGDYQNLDAESTVTDDSYNADDYTEY